MPQSVYLQYLSSQQRNLTFGLTEWLIDRYQTETVRTLSGQQAARLQCWVNLLVNSLLESLRLNQAGLVGDYVIVMAECEPELFEPNLWQLALSRLGCNCHRLLKGHFKLTWSLEQLEETDPIEHYEELAHCLTCLDRALAMGQQELGKAKRSQQWAVQSANYSLLNLPILTTHPNFQN